MRLWSIAPCKKMHRLSEEKWMCCTEDGTLLQVIMNYTHCLEMSHVNLSQRASGVMRRTWRASVAIPDLWLRLCDS